MVYEKIYFEVYSNDQYIWRKINIAQLYFILERPDLCFYIFRLTDIYRFLTMYMVKNHLLLENLRISKRSLSILKKFQHNLSVANIKYNYAILFLSQIYWSFVHMFQNILSHRLKLYTLRFGFPIEVPSLFIS